MPMSIHANYLQGVLDAEQNTTKNNQNYIRHLDASPDSSTETPEPRYK